MGATEGDVEIDLVTRSCLRDGFPVKLVITETMFDWIAAEHGRKSLPDRWVHAGKVVIHYARQGWRDAGGVPVQLRVIVNVETDFGYARSEFSNDQVLWGVP